MTFVFRAALVAALACAAGPNALSAQESAPPPTVTVVTLQPQDVTLTSTLPGRVHASAEEALRDSAGCTASYEMQMGALGIRH